MSGIHSEVFCFGRKIVLDLLKKRLLGLKEGYRQNVAILGSRYIGKTTVLQRFLFDLDERDVVNIYVDCEHKDLRYLANKYIGSLLYNYSKIANLPLHEEIPLLLESTKTSIPQTAKLITKIQSDIGHGNMTESYRALVRLPEVFCLETNTFCLLILEEFHNLEELAISDVFKELGKNIMTQRRCLYIVTSSCLEKAKKVLSEKLSLLFGNFETVSLEVFDGKTSQDFITNRLGSIHIGTSLRDFLIDYTGGYPLYLNLLLKELKYLSALHRQEEIYVPLVIQAVENTIFDRWGVLSRHFELLVDHLSSGKGNGVVASLLIALSKGKQRLKELSKGLSLTQGVVSQKLNRLLEEGIVSKNGGFFYLEDKLFRYWLKYVFQKHRRSVECSWEKQHRDFVDEFMKFINEFRLSTQKTFSSRVAELLHCFDNESVLVNGRRYKLPLFSKILPFKIRGEGEGHFDVIKAVTPEGPWLVIVKSSKVIENDVNEFLLEAKKIRPKPLGCIMISLSELDENAKLKALQERMWIWHEQELNALLNYYDQPYFVWTEQERTRPAVLEEISPPPQPTEVQAQPQTEEVQPLEPQPPVFP